MNNILYNNTDEAQSINDLDMVAHHCLNRLDSIEPQMKEVQIILDKRKQRERE